MSFWVITPWNHISECHLSWHVVERFAKHVRCPGCRPPAHGSCQGHTVTNCLLLTSRTKATRRNLLSACFPRRSWESKAALLIRAWLVDSFWNVVYEIHLNGVRIHDTFYKKKAIRESTRNKTKTIPNPHPMAFPKFLNFIYTLAVSTNLIIF